MAKGKESLGKFKDGKFKDGKGKGKHKKGAKVESQDRFGNTLVSSTPDGRELCFAFNAQGCGGKCGRVHACRVKGMQPVSMQNTARVAMLQLLNSNPEMRSPGIVRRGCVYCISSVASPGRLISRSVYNGCRRHKGFILQCVRLTLSEVQWTISRMFHFGVNYFHK